MVLTPAQQTDMQLRKTLGRNHLRENRIDEAFRLYASLVRDYPQDVESYLVLGDLFLASENPTAALGLYHVAREKMDNKVEIEKRLSLIQNEYEEKIIPLQPDQVKILLADLLDPNQQIREEDLQKAGKLLHDITQSSNPGELVAENLDQIEKLLPAFLEINIRQAKEERRDDIRDGLEQIKRTLLEVAANQINLLGGVTTEKTIEISPERVRVLILVADEMDSSPRVDLICEALRLTGHEVHLKSAASPAMTEMPSLVIASNPHTNPWLLEQMASFTANRIPIILDLDMDYEQMPLNHPDYLQKGLGLPANARAYTAAMLLANMITTPSPRFAEQLSRTGYRAIPVPDGWSRKNLLWEKPMIKRPTINIGWIGHTGSAEDLLEIRRIIIRVIREFPRTQLIIAEDPKAFQLFESVPENRKLFLPEVALEDFPYLYGQMDVLLIPLRNIPFHYSLSDSVLVYAGIRKIPWVASRLPATTAWNSGGLLSSAMEEWHTNLRQLVMDEELRHKLGEAGYLRAMEREAGHLRLVWENAIHEVIQNPNRTGFLVQPTRSGKQDGSV